MGSLDLSTELLMETALHKNTRIQVIASAHHVAILSESAGSTLLPELQVTPLDLGAAVPADLLRDVSLLVLEVEPDNGGSIQRLRFIREQHPDLLIVAAIQDANVALVRTLVREGITDIVSLPFNVTDLLQVTLDTVAKREADSAQSARLAPMVAVVRSIGGCGATSIATHLAADLAAHDDSGRGAVIADLDLQFGGVADYLGVKPRGSLTDLLDAEGRLDEDLLHSVVGQGSGGVSVIAAPEAIMPLESVDTDQLLRVIQMLRQQFGFTVLDLPANWTNWTLSAALASDVIVLVVELSVVSLRQAKRRLELFRSVGIDDRAIEIVVNRVEKRLFRTIDLDDVSTTLGHSVLGSIALDDPLVSTAQNHGQLVGEIKRNCNFAKDIARIGEALRANRLARSH